jgi:hypothetical protein
MLRHASLPGQAPVLHISCMAAKPEAATIGNSALRGFGIGVQRRKQNGKLICDILEMTPNAIGCEALSAFQPEHGLSNGGTKNHT